MNSGEQSSNQVKRNNQRLFQDIFGCKRPAPILVSQTPSQDKAPERYVRKTPGKSPWRRGRSQNRVKISTPEVKSRGKVSLFGVEGKKKEAELRKLFDEVDNTPLVINRVRRRKKRRFDEEKVTWRREIKKY